METNETIVRIEAAMLLLWPVACSEGPARNSLATAMLDLEKARDLVRSLADAKGTP